MAQLIKFRTEPIKVLRRQKDQTLIINGLIRDSDMRVYRESLAIHDEFISRLKKMLRDYQERKIDYSIQAKKRGLLRSQIITLSEIISLVAWWQLSVDKESDTLYSLAETLALNVTNSDKLQKTGQDRRQAIRKRMQRFLTAEIYLPRGNFERLVQKSSKLKSDFESLTKILIKEHDVGAQLAIISYPEKMVLEFNDSDAETILIRVLQRLQHFPIRKTL